MGHSCCRTGGDMPAWAADRKASLQALKEPQPFIRASPPQSIPPYSLPLPPSLPAGSLIVYLAEYRLLFCTRCRSAVPAQKLRSHLIHSHQQKANNWKPIVTEMQLHPALQTYDDIRPLPDGSLPFAYLPAPASGYQCAQCLSFKTINRGALRSHLNAEHQIYNSDLLVTGIACYLQRRVQTTRGRWWTVSVATTAATIDKTPASIQQAASDTLAGLDKRDLSSLAEMEADEQQRLEREAQGAADFDLELEPDEDSERLRACEWPQWFLNKPLHVLTSASSMPQCASGGYNLGNCMGVEWVSSRTCEVALELLARLTDDVLQRCEQTLERTPRSLRCATTKVRKNHMSWYSASHVELSRHDKDQELRMWDWADQSLWDWQGGIITEHTLLRLFDDLENFDFNYTRDSIPIQKEFARIPEGIEAPHEVDAIVGKRECTPRAVEYQVKWVGYPHKKDYTWEPGWRLKIDVPKIVKSYERVQRDIRNKQASIA
ncbi:hypothetical protein DL98DRAFT_189649 [Cadophora sp. DSE1049]|nr:hypothetical protein DL98DRAFT_189649 [Cadophora sp. DSE1049]